MPAATCTFWSRIARSTSADDSPRASSTVGSIHTRIAYWAAPKIVTEPTPGRRWICSRSCSVAKLLRNTSSCRPSGDVTVIIWAKSGIFFWVFRPMRRTSSGSDDSAAETRFWICTAAVSRSVPVRNVTVSL